MNPSVKIKCLKTGIPGLDLVLGDGLPEYSFNLIAGAPGCGKTTLAHQIMFAMATANRPALYLTVLGEPPIKMLRYQQQFTFFDHDRIGASIQFANLSEQVLAGSFDQILQAIKQLLEERNPSYVFVDSFRSIVLSRHAEDANPARLQRFVQDLALLMTSSLATTFLIGEYEGATEPAALFTIADGLIWLHQSVERDSMVRKLEIRKMRGGALLAGLHTFRIDRTGIKVFAPARTLAAREHGGRAPVQPPRLSMGVPGLDTMMGGGLPSGYSLLVAGPSGSGKSVLAAAFLAEGVRCGEPGVIVAFEQNPFRSRDRLVADLIDQGQVGLIDAKATDLSITEVAQLLMDEIHRRKATRVVIDSLSGFELELAPTFRKEFRESLARLMTALISTGATVLLTSELEDRYTDLRFSPYGSAFLTDAIIVQRYIELDSRLRRVMAVVKVRASAHSHELREFTIDGTGIRIGDLLVEQEGLLGGHPTQKRRPAQASGATRVAIADGSIDTLSPAR